MLYTSGRVYLPDGRAIALRCVGSIKIPDDEQKVIDKLKDDRCLEIVMTSGHEYIVSMRAIQKFDARWVKADVDELRYAICDKWNFIFRD